MQGTFMESGKRYAKEERKNQYMNEISINKR